MSEQLDRIKGKIGQLAWLDKNLSLFGSNKHKYLLNKTISIHTIRQFEQKHKITLPTEYVEFLTKIGNGGAGPFYGLEPLENALFDDLHYKRPDSLLDPSKPFVHTDPWNLEFRPTVDVEDNEEEYYKQKTEFEENYFNPSFRNGAIAIYDYGCAVSLNLVVNGQEFGHIWTDDRGNDQGIYPSYELGNKNKITFLNWYELWLDNSLKEINNKPPVTKQKTQIAQPASRPWWKIW